MCEQHAESFEHFNSTQFDIFKFSEEVGRENTLSFMVYKMIENLPGFNLSESQVKDEKLVKFLRRITIGYYN